MDYKFGQIAENTRINENIYYCFSFLHEKEQLKFVNKFRKQPHSETQIIHTLRELQLGAYLVSNGFIVENDHKFDSKTPDWTILDNLFNVRAIVEMVYHHPDRNMEDSILEQRQNGKSVIGYWPDGNDPEHNRLYSHIQDKASKYKDLVTKINIPYLVAIFIDFLAIIDVQETKECLMGGENQFFMLYPDLSGVLQFDEVNGGLCYFTYLENPFAVRKIDIPSGYLMKR